MKSSQSCRLIEKQSIVTNVMIARLRCKIETGTLVVFASWLLIVASLVAIQGGVS